MLIHDTGFIVCFLHRCSLCMFCILHWILKHISDSRRLSNLNCCACCDDMTTRWIHMVFFSANISSGKIVGSGSSCVLLGITVSVCAPTTSDALFVYMAQKKRESGVSLSCGAFHPRHNFIWRTIAGINCSNFAYCTSRGGKKGKVKLTLILL